MREKLACQCRKSRASDAGKIGLLMQKKLVSRCGKSREASWALSRSAIQMSAAEGGGNQVR
jgi:hypothetical protein